MAKDIKQLAADIARHQKELSRYMKRDAPRIAGKLGVDHFRESFDNEGFTNNGLHKWPARKHDTGRKILTGETKELQDSIDYDINLAKVGFGFDVAYGSIHNQGGITHPSVTKKSRKWAWYMFKKTGDPKYKGLAMTRKTRLEVRIQQRQSIGHSKELIDKVDTRIERDITNILNS
jgi:phage gpG-like protein